MTEQEEPKRAGSFRERLKAELESPAHDRRFGTGWISGVIGVVLASAGLLLVLSLRLPGSLSMPELREYLTLPAFRFGLHLVLVAGFLFALLSLVLRRERVLGTTGIVLVLAATLLGGSRAEGLMPDPTPLYVGLDFFVLNIVFTGLLFVPLERAFAHHAEQPIFRSEWRDDLFYYLVSSLAVQVLTYLSFLPSHGLVWALAVDDLRQWVGGLPFLVQLVAIMFLTDLVQYWVHRVFHQVPALWRFHAVHHSARTMDWMAGARMHILEVILLRAATLIPMMVLGFDPVAVSTYIFLVYLISTFVHANVGWRLRWLELWFVTPRFHHWHHGIEKEAVDVNFAVHFPLFDRIFGTYYLPEGKWPSGYGVGGYPVPRGYLAQLRHPFTRHP